MMSVQQVAEELGVSPQTVYRLCESGEIRCYRVGPRKKAIRVSGEDLHRYLQGVQCKSSCKQQREVNGARGAKGSARGRKAYRHLDL